MARKRMYVNELLLRIELKNRKTVIRNPPVKRVRCCLLVRVFDADTDSDGDAECWHGKRIDGYFQIGVGIGIGIGSRT